MVSQVAVSSRYLMSSVPTMMAMMARKKELCNTFISMMIFCKSNLSDRKENLFSNCRMQFTFCKVTKKVYAVYALVSSFLYFCAQKVRK